MKSILKRMFAKKSKSEEEVLNQQLQENMPENIENTIYNIKKSLVNLNDLEKVEIKEYLEKSLKNYEIARLEKELWYADDIERRKIKRQLNKLLNRNSQEDYADCEY